MKADPALSRFLMLAMLGGGFVLMPYLSERRAMPAACIDDPSQPSSGSGRELSDHFRALSPGGLVPTLSVGLEGGGCRQPAAEQRRRADVEEALCSRTEWVQMLLLSLERKL